jgi:hypothetical protein
MADFDLSDFNSDFAGADGRDRNVKFIPSTGNYKAMLTKMWVTKRDDGEMALNWSFRLLDGPPGRANDKEVPSVGEVAFKRNRIKKDPMQMGFLKTDLLTAGLKTEDLNKIHDEEFLKQAYGKVYDVSIKVTDPAKGYYDTRINRVSVEK